jgi:hypothetical protein
MGVERAVSCWYARRQLLLLRIAQLQATLAQSDTQIADQVADKAAVRVALAKAQEELRTLGPCPRPMMG